MKKSATKQILSILFIGNSFSYYHDLPRLVARFGSMSGDTKIEVDGVFRGGATLGMLWDEGQAIRKLQDRDWDYVVLQERGRLDGSMKGTAVHVGKPTNFFAAGIRFDRAIKAANAKTVLYCPPAFLGLGFYEEAKKVSAAYVALATRLRAILIPSLAAFELATRERPDLNLYERDRHHPSPFGTYLIASLFGYQLFDRMTKHFPSVSYVSRSSALPRNPRRFPILKPDREFLWSVARRVLEGSIAL